MSTQHDGPDAGPDFDALCTELADTIDLVDQMARWICTPEYVEQQLRKTLIKAGYRPTPDGGTDTTSGPPDPDRG